MARYAIGDVQGCHAELLGLLRRLGYRVDRDELWFVGDLVNRGPASLEVLRFVSSLGAGATTVLGNHDLHLLAVALGTRRRLRRGDTLDAILDAPDRDRLLEWLLERPLAHRDVTSGDLLVHAGLVPQWDAATALDLAAEVSAALRTHPRELLDGMYGDEPRRWDAQLHGTARLRFVINALTRMRYCHADGTLDLERKEAPVKRKALRWRASMPWFEIESRRSASTRVIFGHWSTLGLLVRERLLALDTGCVWGGALSACRLDGEPLIWSEPCSQAQRPGGDS